MDSSIGIADDKLFSRSLISKFTQAIVRCRPIPPIGAEQIILDLQTLKNCLLTLPQLEPDTPVPSAYTRYVTKSVGRLDTLLKIIMTPEDPAEDFVKHYILLIPCQSFSDFQKVLDLKVLYVSYNEKRFINSYTATHDMKLTSFELNPYALDRA